jgi:hypothetical protein
MEIPTMVTIGQDAYILGGLRETVKDPGGADPAARNCLDPHDLANKKYAQAYMDVLTDVGSKRVWHFGGRMDGPMPKCQAWIPPCRHALRRY